MIKIFIPELFLLGRSKKKEEDLLCRWFCGIPQLKQLKPTLLPYESGIRVGFLVHFNGDGLEEVVNTNHLTVKMSALVWIPLLKKYKLLNNFLTQDLSEPTSIYHIYLLHLIELGRLSY